MPASFISTSPEPRLSGRFVLVRSNSARYGQDSWLLLRKRDERSIEGWDANAFPESVKTGRTNDEVAADYAS
jgi:bifunctional non-homologous end joining protein LigD